MYNGEKFNSITHLIGAALALVGFGALITIGLQAKGWATLISFSVFGLSLILLYAMSTLFHSVRSPQLKKFFQKLDHVAIYILIAGTYTPYMMLSLGEGDGMVMLTIVWGLAVLGILLDVFVKARIELLQLIIYLSMGWLCTWSFSDLQAVIPSVGIILLVAGGIAYTVGITFYVLDHLKKLKHAHGIWHLFVLLGSSCHFLSIAVYVS